MNYVLTRYFLFPFLACGVLTGCDGGVTESKTRDHTSMHFRPVKIEQLDGWHGARVTKIKRGNRLDCNITFPEQFGMAAEEFDLLLYVIANHTRLRRSSDCDSSQTIYQMLDQIRNLTVQHQSLVAASVLLEEGSKEFVFSFDGEVAETYTESYVVPVLEEFKNLPSVLNSGLIQRISQNICGRLSFYEDVKDTKLKGRVSVLIKKLKSDREAELADSILKRCAHSGVRF